MLLKAANFSRTAERRWRSGDCTLKEPHTPEKETKRRTNRFEHRAPHTVGLTPKSTEHSSVNRRRPLRLRTRVPDDGTS